MNVDYEGSSILAFRDPHATKNAPEQEPRKALDGEQIEHCRARERAERAAAKKAASLEARRVHQELAQAYAALIEVSAE